MLTRRLYSLIASSSVVQVGGLVATLLVGVLLARGLGVQGYGEYGLAFAVITLLAVPVEFGAQRVVLREVAAASGRNDDETLYGVIGWARRATLAASLAILAVTAIVLLATSGRELSVIETAILIGLPLLPLGAAAAVRTNALMGLQHIVIGQLPILLLRPSVYALLLLAVLHWHPTAGPAEAMALNVVTAAAALLLAHVLLVRRLPPKPPREIVKAHQWTRSAFAMAAIDAARVIQGQVGIMVVGTLATTYDAGLFRVAASAAIIAVLPLALLEAVSSPHLARLFALQKSDDLQRLATQAAWLGVIGVTAITLVILIFGRQLLAILFGPEFESAYLPLLVMCAGQLINALFGLNSILLVMTNLERRLTRAVVAALAVNVLLAAALVPSLGATGAAIGAVGYVLVWNLAAWWDAHRLRGINTSILGGVSRSWR